MFRPVGHLRVWLCTTPTDMRRSFNGLSAMVKRELCDNPLSGAMFVFVNRKRTRTTFRIPIVRSNHPLQVAPTSRSRSGDTQDGSSRWRRGSAF